MVQFYYLILLVNYEHDIFKIIFRIFNKNYYLCIPKCIYNCFFLVLRLIFHYYKGIFKRKGYCLMWQYTTQIQSQLDIHIALLMQSLWKFIAQKNICIVICSICNTMSFIILESWQFGTNKTKEHYDRNPELYLHFSNENSHFCKSLFDMWRWLFPCHNLINTHDQENVAPINS